MFVLAIFKRFYHTVSFSAYKITRKMPDQPLQTTTAPSHVIWKSEETELLLDWMEENTDLIGGIQTIWHQAVKAAVFSDKDHITLKKINDKAQNMKRSYRRAKQLQFQSDFGLRAEDNPQHNNGKIDTFLLLTNSR
jgi:hypothetical protein